MRQNMVGTTLDIIRGTRPAITPAANPGFNIRDWVKDYQRGVNWQQEQDDRQQRQGLIGAYNAAVDSGDEQAQQKSLALLYPELAARMAAQREKWQQDNVWEREKLQKTQDFQERLAFLQNALKTPEMNIFDKKRIENIAKDMDTNIKASQERINDYNRMEQLLNSPNVSTGGIMGHLAAHKLPVALLGDETQELQAIINKIVPQMRPAGSGNTSDRDMAMFEKATIGLDKDKDANLNIIAGRRAADENAIALEQLRAEWVSGGGSLADFDRHWRQYLEANHIFNEEGGLNKARISAYDWFRGNRKIKDISRSLADFNPQNINNKTSENDVIDYADL